jgi:hypothetical protein
MRSFLTIRLTSAGETACPARANEAATAPAVIKDVLRIKARLESLSSFIDFLLFNFLGWF